MAAPVSASESSILIVCDIVLVLIFAIGVVANSLVLLVFYRKPGLRTVSNRFVINLVATNLAACVVELPLVLLDNVLGPTAETRAWLCAADEGVTAAVCSASVLAVLLIALDQYWAVVDPLRYHARIGAARSAGMIVTAWGVALVFGVCGGVHLTTGPKPSLWYSCGSSADPQDVTSSSDLYSILFAAIFSTCIFVLPFGAILWIYVCIYTAAHRNSQRTRRRGSATTVSTNIERQYFPIAEGKADYACPSRRDKVNLQRSQTFAEGNLNPRTMRKSSEGDLSFKPIEITVICVNSEMLDANKATDRKCSFEIPETVTDDNKVVNSNTDVLCSDNSGKKSTNLQNDVPIISQKTQLSAMFSVGPPELDLEQDSQAVLVVNEDNTLKSETMYTSPSQQFTTESNTYLPISVTVPILKQTSCPSATLTVVQPLDRLQSIPNNAFPAEKTYVAAIPFVAPISETEEMQDLQVVSRLESFAPLKKGSPHSNSMPTVTITPPQAVPGRTSLSHNSSLRNSGNLVTALRSRISNASLFRYREEMRAARISVLVIIMALVNWLPYCALSLLYSNIFKMSLNIPHYVNALGLVSLSSGALISPCLFAYRNRKLQREVKKLLGFPRSKEDGSSRREDQFKGENNLSLDGVKKNLRKLPLTQGGNGVNLKPGRRLWEWRAWKPSVSPDSSFIESNLLQHNSSSLGAAEGKEAGLLLSCMKGSRWVRQEGTCDLNILHNSALHTSVDTCRSSFSSGGSTNSTQCTTSSLETALDNN